MSFKDGANMKKLMILATLALAVSACTKKAPYETEYKGFTDDGKGEVMSKSQVPQDVDMLYSVAGLQMSRKMVGGQPYSFGENKRVRLKFTQNALQVIEQERDERYRRAINDKLILQIPIENVDYECAKDAFGECTSKEQENTKIPWNQKTKFRLKPMEVKMGAAEFLPVLDESFFSGDKCFTEVSSELQSYSVTPEAINIEVKRSFTQSLECMSSLDTLSDTSISAVFHYSMVRADSILTPEFKTIAYDDKDEHTFGFFMTTHNVLDVDNSDMESGQIRIMNHWNPNRTNIDYHLSEEFAKPENAYLKDLTHEAVKRLNVGLAEAGAKFQITLHDPSGKNPGDIRNSMIVLVEDPDESGLLGYGPQTEDPKTGEIISARTIMFLAGFEQETHMIYDEVNRILKEHAEELADKAEKQAEAARAAAAQEKAFATKEKDASGMTMVSSQVAHKRQLKSSDLLKDKLNVNRASLLRLKKAAGISLKASKPSVKGLGAKGNAKKIVKDLKNYSRRKNPEYLQGDIKAYVKYLREAKNCALTADFGSLTKMRPELAQQIAATYASKDGNGLRPWSSLKSSERQDLVKRIVSEIWIPVVLHEMGHNMGLRHNFQGSEDKKNFYTKNELQAKSVNHEIPYSTIMEYGDDLHALPFLGKYDIAALRYGYARQVEIETKNASGDVVKSEMRNIDNSTCGKYTENGAVKCLEDELNRINDEYNKAHKLGEDDANYRSAGSDKKPGIRIRPYGFCTDESVGPNVGCRRFDEGSNPSEIADFLIKSYKDNYDRRNRRNDRSNFSSYDDGLALRTKYERLQELRSFMEGYEGIKHTWGLADDAKEFTDKEDPDNEYLIQLKEAALKSVNFFLDILEVPDTTCLIASKANPDAGVTQVVPLVMIGGLQDRLTCLGIELTGDNVVIGEAGKSFNDKKDPNSTNAYVDQIDVRGYYLEKMAAARVLFRRNMTGELGTHNDYMDNAWDIADVRDRVQNTLIGLMTNKLESTQEVTLDDGSTALFKANFDYHSSHLVAQPLHSMIAKQLGIAYSPSYFSEILGNEVVKEALNDADSRIEGESLKSLVSIRVLNGTEFGSGIENPIQAQVLGDRMAFAGKSNVVATDLLSDIVVSRKFQSMLDESRDLKINRPTYNQLIGLLNNKMNPKATYQDPTVLTEKELRLVTTLTDDERAEILGLAKTIGPDILLLKLRQLRDGAIMPETEIMKIISFMPQF